MKRSHLITGASMAVVCSGVYLVSSVRSSAPQRSDVGTAQRTSSEPTTAGADPIGELQAEVRRLRAEAVVKDNLIKLIAVQSRAPEKAPEAAPAPLPQSPAADRVTQVCSILDERIRAASGDTASAHTLKQALQRVIDSVALGQTKVTSLHCSGSMCKVGLTGESDVAIGSSAEAMAERAPKMFGATAMYQTKPGESAMYLARSQDDLAIDPDTELTQ